MSVQKSYKESCTGTTGWLP